ncbi:hypothetical protein Mal4_24480 [Maioricimonas rarisocia]|uniref:Planctomycete cytochrome C n=1 Tax=Maioricimonas rarisocia TaxID=2528026 RepID=A0A517Z6K5_9PLAN|nr:DUF1549 and DUF1553 domain-containing protein [Maioricimonas rarisocia]QDU38126.1 hypothetical protein Mal4_24480 [Maioricimonas rarisocia]
MGRRGQQMLRFTLGALLCLSMWGVALATDAAGELPITEADRDYWAFRPIERPPVPAVINPGWCRTPIDFFVLAGLQEEELEPVGPAKREALLRRVTFDLTGLPPTPAEQAAFLADESHTAYETVVERLLASPAYGERWAQHWLDLVRFAETDGFEHDKVRPQAWRYRDWVIAALNADMSYDEFIARQLAGDLLAPDDADAQIATGFLLCGPDMPDINLREERRHNFLNDMTANVGEVLLGLQFGCARCHDHKADPISQLDFYRLRAFFEPIDLFADHPLPGVVKDGEAVRARVVRNGKGESNSFLWIRGDFRRRGPRVQPAYPRVVNEEGDEVEPGSDVTDRRLALVEWLTDPSNPLTARVIVNRVWQHHFGTGLSPTPSDFGLMGIGPSHPELLDWLSADLVASGWSLKRLHRQIVMSSTYRLASRPDTDTDRARWNRLVESDSANDLLGRGPRRRLEAEAIRDAMLAVSSTLNDKRGGPGVRPPLPPEVVVTLLKNQWPVTKDEAEHNRRSIYLFVRRNLRFPFLEVFDKPDTNLSCAQRSETTIAPQALHLLNSDFSLECARHLAARLVETDGTDHERIEQCYALVLGRIPGPAELAAAEAFLGQQPGRDDWTDFCLAMFNLNEFVYLD